MNKVFLRGNLTRNPELRYTASNIAVVSFGIAVKREFKNANGEYESDFLNCKAFNKLAELISEKFKMGSGIIIEGCIQTGSYEKEDGTKVYTTDIIVEKIEFERKKAEENIESKVDEKTGKVKEEKTDPFKSFGEKISADIDPDLPF